MIVPIVAVAILMGVLPNLFLRPIEPSVERMLNQIQQRRADRDRADVSSGVQRGTSDRADAADDAVVQRDRADGLRDRRRRSPR